MSPQDLCPDGHAQPVLVHVWPDLHATKPLHEQTPAVQSLARPTHWAADVQFSHAVAPQTMPPAQAELPWHVQAPSVHPSALNEQSAFVQQAPAPIQTPLQNRVADGQLVAESPWAASVPASRFVGAVPVDAHATRLSATKSSDRSRGGGRSCCIDVR
jgi:hypothetical protein